MVEADAYAPVSAVVVAIQQQWYRLPTEQEILTNPDMVRNNLEDNLFLKSFGKID